MLRVTVTDLKNRLSEYLRRVKRGETLEILEHSVAVARVEAIRPGLRSADDRLARLVREGMVRPALEQPDHAFLDRPPLPCTGDAVRAVVEERGER